MICSVGPWREVQHCFECPATHSLGRNEGVAEGVADEEDGRRTLEKDAEGIISAVVRVRRVATTVVSFKDTIFVVIVVK